jgi:glycosyltransferase involved in cell wall biosynthesis
MPGNQVEMRQQMNSLSGSGLNAKGDAKSMIVVAIPALNEEKTIGRVVLKSRRHANKVIVCDDGSTDMTGAIAKGLGAEVITHEGNQGKGAALRSLFLAAKDANADILVTIDGDGQHDPSEIPKLVEAIESGSADIVIGSRFHEGNQAVPKYRLAGNRMLNSLVGSGIRDTQSGFRAYGRKALRSLLPAEMGMGADSELLVDGLNKGLRITETPVSVIYGEGKTSKHNPFFHTLDVFFSVIKLTSIRHPLIFYGIPGVVLLIGGVFFAYRAIALFTLQQQITNATMTYELIGFALTLFGLLTLFTGVILFTLSTVVRKVAGG